MTPAVQQQRRQNVALKRNMQMLYYQSDIVTQKTTEGSIPLSPSIDIQQLKHQYSKGAANWEPNLRSHD
jgi:uncharacterized alpha/beta hydrolase family protein